MMPTLDISLQNQKIGSLSLLAGDQSLFTFDEEYIQDSDRHTLSQFYLSKSGDLRLDPQLARGGKLPGWFSNLLPEGPLREYLAKQGGINPRREFSLLALLGEDLPGAVRVTAQGASQEMGEPASGEAVSHDGPLRFSLAGIQLKFSGQWRDGRATIPASGIGGHWILKLPSAAYPAVPENEAAMLTLAARVGIEVPEHFLIPVAAIEGLPRLGVVNGAQALAVRRFDRTEGDRRIHMEDLAQVFGIFPHDKYKNIGLARIAELIATVMGQTAVQDFVSRLAFIILTGNGDMHLKNWSLLYPDGTHPRLSPAYDLVSTVPYLPNDGLALNLMSEKAFTEINTDSFRRLAEKAGLPERETLHTVARMVDAVRAAWQDVQASSQMPFEIATRITDHMQSLPLLKVAG